MVTEGLLDDRYRSTTGRTSIAPPFTGLDTLPALGVVLLSLGVLLEDFAVVAIAIVVGAAGVVLEIELGKAALHALNGVF